MVPGLGFRATAELLIKTKNEQGLRSLLASHQQHADLNEKDEDGYTLLMVAAHFGDVNIIKLILNHDANVHAEEDDEKTTAIHVAAKYGHANICSVLLEVGANPSATDSWGWTPLLWACYRGHYHVVDVLISFKVDVNACGLFNLSGLVLAAGRGYSEVVQLLLDNQARVDVGDKYGTTALIWACRKGHKDIVQMLLNAGASVDMVGMHSWTPLLTACRGNHPQVVDYLLEYGPNLNCVDREGMTALCIACKEGYHEIAFKLLAAGAYTNLQDKAGDTNLIHATKGGHRTIVEALIKRYADVDIRGKDGKTCLHWAIDKGHTSIIRLILATNPDMELRTTDGVADTALLRAVRTKNAADVVEMLLERKAKISATDAKGDTCLHIAMRARSKAIVEVLLRNPKHSQLLYKPNKRGETPYDMDAASSQRSILGQLFGARRLNTHEDSENLLGYDLYSSALADILTGPSLAMPITVGLYAKWGSGKSFLLDKLRNEMKNFAGEWVMEPRLHNSLLLFVVVMHVAAVSGVLAWFISSFTATNMSPVESSVVVGLVTATGIFIIAYFLLIGLMRTHKYFLDGSILYNLNVFLASRFNALKLLLYVLFRHPPGIEYSSGGDGCRCRRFQPLRLLFSEHTKVITSAGGQNSVIQMVGSLYDAIEAQYGMFSSRLYRVFSPRPVNLTSPLQWRRLCCIPYVVIYMGCFVCILVTVILATISVKAHWEGATTSKVNNIVRILLIVIAVVVGLVIASNAYILGSCVKALLLPHRQHLQRTMAKLDLVKSEGYLQAMKNEVQLMLDMIRCLDAFTQQQTRLVIVVDGLDSCEQSKVLSVLDTVHMLFSDDGCPFIILLAVDPHVITKAVELNMHQAYRQTSIGGNAYLRNIVHLPFFLQNASLRKVRIAQQLAKTAAASAAVAAASACCSKRTTTGNWMEAEDRRNSLAPADTNLLRKGGKMVSGRQRSDSISSVSSSRLPQEDTNIKMFLNDDYFSDVNIRSMRRLMNVIYVMGRLLKAFNVDFNWYHLATWVHISEQWPYRLSWMLYYCDQNEGQSVLSDSMSLRDLYEKIKAVVPAQKDIEPLLEMDRDEKKLDAILSMKKNMTVRDVKIFLPFTINLDPYIKKVIREENQIMGGGGGTVSAQTSGLLTHRQVSGRMVSDQQQQEMLIPLSNNGHQAPFTQYSSPYVIGPPPVHDPYSRHTSAVDHLPGSMHGKILSQLTKDDVCILLRSINGMTRDRLDIYCDIIMAQNISGAVLSYCNISELKTVMNMNFGDWEMFQMYLLGLREQEHRQRCSATSGSLITTGNCDNLRENPVRSTSPNALGHQMGNSMKSSSTTEKNVKLEDDMISGLLSTLNEEAQEDILTEELKGTIEHQPIRSSVDAEVVYLAHDSSNGTVGGGGGGGGVHDVERCNPVSRLCVVANTHRAAAACSTNSSIHELSELTSQPTSPTKSLMSINLPFSKSRFMRDRVDSLVEETMVKGSTERVEGLVAATQPLIDRRVCTSNGTTASTPIAGGDQEEPYTWITQTAPASPFHCRKRTASHSGDDSNDNILSASGPHLWQCDHHDRQLKDHYSIMSSSLDKMGDKFKRKMRRALNSLDQHHSHCGIPIVQRANITRVVNRHHHHRHSGQGAGGDNMHNKDGDRFSTLKRRLSFDPQISQIFTRIPENMDWLPEKSFGVISDEDEDNCSSSPEQQTVTKRPSSNLTSSRGPPIQKLFSQSAVVVSGEGGLLSPSTEGSRAKEATMTAILPDGKVMKATKPDAS